MSTTPLFVPYAADVQRYLQIRRATTELNMSMVQTIPPRAFRDIGSILGLTRRGRLALRKPEEMDILLDACLFDWIRKGRNLVERYADRPFTSAPRDRECLRRLLHAEYRIIVPRKYLQDAGFYAIDVLSDKQLFVMDVAMSHCRIEYALATRLVPLDGCWMTGGAALPASRNDVISIVMRLSQHNLLENGLLENGGFSDAHAAALLAIQTLLATGASEAIEYRKEDRPHPEPQVRAAINAGTQHHGPRPLGRNSPCSCGSRKRFKRCCGRTK